MTDPTNLSDTPFMFCASYRILDLDIQAQAIYDSESQWLVRALIVPDWSDEPVDFYRTVETLEEALRLADDIERCAR